MSALNQKGKAKVTPRVAAVSYNGNIQTKHSDAFDLYSLTVSSLLGKDSFYEDDATRVARLQTLVSSVVASNQLDFIGNLIVHARKVMHIRSMPVLLTVLFAKALRDQNKSYESLRAVVREVIARADQITDMYATALSVFGDKKAIPMAIKRGVADAFNKFDEYQLQKYSSSKAVKLKDVLRIVHPVGKSDEQKAIFARVISDSLNIANTWETKLSMNGQLKGSEKKTDKQLWESLVNNETLQYMALLRNLRNIYDAKVSDDVKKVVCDRIANETQVLKSKQLPFRFISAIESVSEINDAKLNRALSRAVDLSLKNLPKIGDNIWIIVDCSSSMNGKPFDTAAMFASALAKANADANNVKVTLFSNLAAHSKLNTDNPVLTMVAGMKSEIYGGGTNLEAAIALKKTLGFEPDTVIVFSDMQINSLSRMNALDVFQKNTVKIAVNLEGYESTPLTEQDGWYQLAGFSERLFDFIPAMRDKENVVKTLTKAKVFDNITKLSK